MVCSSVVAVAGAVSAARFIISASTTHVILVSCDKSRLVTLCVVYYCSAVLLSFDGQRYQRLGPVIRCGGRLFWTHQLKYCTPHFVHTRHFDSTKANTLPACSLRRWQRRCSLCCTL